MTTAGPVELPPPVSQPPRSSANPLTRAAASPALVAVVEQYRQHNDALETRLGVTRERSGLAYREREVLRLARLAGSSSSPHLVDDLLDACRTLAGEP